jgi:hypothetical protein
MVDIPITQAHVEWAAAKAMRPGLVSWTNNALDWSHMADYLAERVEGTQKCFMNMGVGHKLIEQTWGTPVGMVMCAGGFSFTGDKAWLNERVFCVDTDAVCKLIGNVYKKEKFWADVYAEGEQARLRRRARPVARHGSAQRVAHARPRRRHASRLRPRDRHDRLR